jgi:RimJ/RimL family protein N-acetyltransferase
VIRLVPLDASHVPALAALLDDPATLRYTRIPEPVPERFAERWVEAFEGGGARAAFAILEDGAFAGVALAPSIDHATRTAELGYVVAREARGRGVATEALRQLTAWAFELGMLRLELLISVDNDASKRVAAAAGYAFEGIRRSAYFKQDLREDTEVWSRLPTDG